MQYNYENKIDFYAQPDVEYLYIVFKLRKKEYGQGNYIIEAEKINKIVNEKLCVCEVKPLFVKPGAPCSVNASAVDETYGFNRYFKVMLSGVDHDANLINVVLQLIAEQDFIELVYPAGKPVGASQGIDTPRNLPSRHYNKYIPGFNPSDLIIPNFYQYQNYLFEPTYTTGFFRIGGIDAEAGWSTLGGDGSYVTLLSYESDAWDTNHVNLPQEREFALGNIDVGTHDTSSVGVMAARPMVTSRVEGIVGIAFNTRVAYADSGIQNIRDAYYLLNAGDVVQVGIQAYVGAQPGCTTNCFVPMEYENAYYDVFRALTDKGVHVILAAGNGALDLDHAGFNGKFNRSVRDSGAIYVGAIDPILATRAFFSNYGSRIDSSSWGFNVVTTSYGSGNLFNEPNAWYRDNFSGTSSATPIVAGAAACLSSIARANNKPLPPRLLREIFTETGTVFLDNDSLFVGTQPNMRTALARFAAIPYDSII
ncbi:S8 family serine peptidase [Sodalis ligni]|uniref:Subtilase family protein n=1 Tax=Sodalis ligni TaxID=2697027 RepID=A0A4R1NKL9_9GAMM|nr:S8 family serine peptidase [Sodalis ligni]TCL06491.1 subtilase family protein [Sodalis ligni]